MAANLKQIVGSSILRKQLIAITGLVMVGFVIAHLAGNLLILLGPKAFNHYAETLASLGELLWVMRFGLLASVLLHIYLTMQLVIENSRARAMDYDVTKDHGDRKMATRAMKYTGIMIVFFLFLHLYDFTFGDKTGQASIVEGLNDGESLGLFGLVWNSFQLQHIWRNFIYILAVSSVGLHLSHAIQSLCQTMGINHPRYTPLIKKASMALGIAVALAFSSIPIYVLLMPKPFGV